MDTHYVYDNYEISGCRRLDDHGRPDPLGNHFERCDEEEAVVWTLYGHIDGRGVEAIGDFPDRDAAEEVYRRITGEPFTGSYRASPRLRLMHASPVLLAACEQVVERWENGDLAEAARACGDAVAVATQRCPPWVYDGPDIKALLASKHEIAVIWSVDDVQEMRPDLNDQQAWEVLKAVQHYHDASIGICWDVLICHAELLFGDAPETVDGEEA